MKIVITIAFATVLLSTGASLAFDHPGSGLPSPFGRVESQAPPSGYVHPARRYHPEIGDRTLFGLVPAGNPGSGRVGSVGVSGAIGLTRAFPSNGAYKIPRDPASGIDRYMR